jgi:hypothetical protein
MNSSIVTATGQQTPNDDVMTSGIQAISSDDFRHSLSQLGVRWRKHRGRDLDLRHQTGAFLNRHLGPPDVRLPHGERVLKLAAKELGTSESELSRLRWFAHHFSDLRELEKKHPKVTSWTQVRSLLPRLSANNREPGTAPDTEARSHRLKQVERSADALAAKLRQLPAGLTGAERSELAQIFWKLAGAVPDSAGVRLSVTTMEVESVHLVQKTA